MKRLVLLFSSFVVLVSVCNAQLVKDNIRLYLPFNGTLIDGSGKSVVVSPSTNALAIGALTYVDGKFGQAGAFNSSPVVTSGMTFVSNANFSICAWVNMAQLSSVAAKGQTIIHQKDLAGGTEKVGRIHFEALAGDYFGSFTSGLRLDNNYGGVPSKFAIDTWYHIANVQDVTNGKHTLYVNGVKVNDTTLVGTELNTQQFVIGGSKAESGAFILGGGKIDELLVTTQVLDASTMDQIIKVGISSLIGYNDAKEVSKSAANLVNYANGQLSLNGISKNASLVIFNISGNKVFEGVASANSMSLKLNKGIYLISVTDGAKKQSAKFSVF